MRDNYGLRLLHYWDLLPRVANLSPHSSVYSQHAEYLRCWCISTILKGPPFPNCSTCVSVVSFFSFIPVRSTPKLWWLIVIHGLMGFRITKEKSEKCFWLYLWTCFQRLMDWGNLSMWLQQSHGWVSGWNKRQPQKQCVWARVTLPLLPGHRGTLSLLPGQPCELWAELISCLPCCDGQNPLKLHVVVFWQAFC